VVDEEMADVDASNNEQPAEEPAAPARNVDGADASMGNDELPPEPAQEESQSEEAEVSSALADITVSDRPTASDSAPTTRPNPPTFNDQTEQAAARTDSENNAQEDTNDDVVMAEAGDSNPAGEDAAEEETSEAPEADAEEPEADAEDNVADQSNQEENATSNDALVCPPDIDPEVFASLPLEMQQEIVAEAEVTQQISGSGLDPTALAALPDEMRREVIQQEQEQQRLREQQAAEPAADPANAEGASSLFLIMLY
jgi:hypothetical protein